MLLLVAFAIMAVLNERANPSAALDVAANWMSFSVMRPTAR